MKKQIFLALILIFTVSAFLMANTSRTYLQRCSLDTGLEAPVTNTGTTTSPDYIVRATLIGPPTGNETVGTDLGTPAGSLRINRAGVNPNFYTATNLNLAIFPTQWQAGWTVSMYVKYIPTNEEVTWSITIPTGTNTINIQAPVQVIPPATVASDTYKLTVNTNVAGVIATGGTAAVGQTTPWVSAELDATTTLVGTYSMTPIAGGEWSPASIEVVAGDFVAGGKSGRALLTKTIAFTWTADADVFNYRLNVAVNLPIGAGVAVTGPNAALNGVIPYFVEDNDGTVANALLGIYTAGPAPAGFHWTNNPITVVEGDFVASKAANTQGFRVNSSKATFNKVANIQFMLEADVPVETWTYNLNVNGPDGYAVTGPVAGTTDYVATDGPGDIANGLLGDYTIAAAPAGFHWQTNPITVTADMFVAAKVDHVYNATIEFVLVENVIDPDNPPMGIVVTPGGDNGMPGTDAGQAAVIYTIAASGVWDVVVTKPAGYGYPWYAYINTTPMLASGPIMLDTYTFLNVNFGAKAPLVVTLDDDESMTLPVELSYFAATLTAQNFVKLTWVSQSETGLLGYRVYRSDNDNQANAVSITPSMIAATNTSTTQTYNVVDEEVVIGNTYYYWLESVDMGHSTFFGPTSVLVEGEVPPVLPEYTTMRNAYPNPFRANTNTTIEVSVKAGETGTVTVYNVLGQVVKTFSVKEGMNSLNWNGKDSKGNACGSGIYFYKLSTPSMNITKKMVIVK